jgi:aspartokinase-like uncharacterized kinase
MAHMITQIGSTDPERAVAAWKLSLIKVGGSLLDWPELPARLAAFLDWYREVEPRYGTRVVLIAGGGPAADLIRVMDRIHGLGEERAHRLAIRVLDWTADLLASLLPGAMVVRRPEALRSAWNARRIPILAPLRILEEFDSHGRDPLPATWEATSDSIAASIAVYLSASRLVLLKSRPLPLGAGIDEAARNGLVDPLFPRIARGLEAVATVCLRDPQPTLRILAPDPPTW